MTWVVWMRQEVAYYALVLGRCLTFSLILVSFCNVLALAQGFGEGSPNVTARIHNNGHLWTVVNNTGVLGNFYGTEDANSRRRAANFFHPRYSRKLHCIYAGPWVGGIVDWDTLVTTAIADPTAMYYPNGDREFFPDFYPRGDFDEVSNDIGSPFYSPRADAGLEFRAVYTDTFANQWFVPYNDYDNRNHKPLNIRITQTSYSWAYRYAEDFIIIDYAIRNLGSKRIHKVFFGMYYNGAVFHEGELPYPRRDDNNGFKYFARDNFFGPCDSLVEIAWVCDNDGQPNGQAFDKLSTTNVFGIAPLRKPETATQTNYNWWVNFWGPVTGWGPRKEDSPENPLRRFAGGTDIPRSDVDKYYVLAHPEVDYSSFMAAMNLTGRNWMPPHELGGTIAVGHPITYVTSYGPFELDPGQTEHVTIVLVIGEDFHTVASAYDDIFDYENPEPFVNQLNFDDLQTNLQWARAIFDNPGVDTDLDGDSGVYYFVVDSTTADSTQVFCSGDGVPDFLGAMPPPAPVIRLITEPGKITIRWNGQRTETFFDTFSRIRDFEGYRVYLARSEYETDISVLASYDRENYNRYKWNRRRRVYLNEEIPFTIDSLRKLYGEDFEPLDYPRHAPLYDDDNAYYFDKLGYNFSAQYDPNGIHKTYPDAVLDSGDVDSEGRMRYYEYEYVINDLLPTIPYYVSVTAFDHGHPAKALDPLETSPLSGQVKVYADDHGDKVLADGKLNVYCYPNPYVIDTRYALRGLENRFLDLSSDRMRIINFANLPNHCTISIYSLDGDLIRTIDHDQPDGSPTASVERFDLITRNTQAMTSGLYYWVVESDHGNQIGKLAVVF